MTEIKINDLRELCTTALLKTGLSQKDTDITVDHYLENECMGKASHGMVRVVEAIHYIHEIGLPAKEGITTVVDNNAIAVLDATQQLGTVAAKAAMESCIERTQKYGIACVGVRNYYASTGSMAYYLRQFVKQDLIAIMGCNSVALVAPPAGKEPVVGTNPLGMGFPSSDGQHFIGDIATSAIALGKVMVMKDKGQQVPDGKLIGPDGNPSTNPDHAFFGQEGAILPLENYHGFSIALMVTLLGGALLGAKDYKSDIYDSDGFFMIGMDPKAFGQENVSETIKNSLGFIRDSAPATGHDSVSIPGDRSAKVLKETLARGTVDVADKTLSKIRALAA